MSERLEDISIAMVAEGQGILAADESTGTIKKRFDSINVESTEENRRDYREMLFRSEEAMKNYPYVPPPEDAAAEDIPPDKPTEGDSAAYLLLEPMPMSFDVTPSAASPRSEKSAAIPQQIRRICEIWEKLALAENVQCSASRWRCGPCWATNRPLR